MNKTQFVQEYRSLVRVHFNPAELISNPSINIITTDKTLSDFLDFYSPRYTKDGKWDNRPVEQIIQSQALSLARLKDIISSPADWGFTPFANVSRLAQSLWAIPIATDISSDRTLILDSNHTICTLLFAGINIKVRCVEIIGNDLSALGTDLRIMHYSI